MKPLTKYAIHAFAAATLFTASVGAAATTITFDDLTANTEAIEIYDGYYGLNWDNFYVLNGADYGYGYRAGNVSGTNVGFNWFANPASFSRATPFNLNSLYITRAWDVGTTRVDGYLGDVLVYSVDIYSTTTAPTFADLHWSSVTRVVIDGDGFNSHSVIDDITITPVPEPETYVMLLAGSGILSFAVHRKSADA